MYFYGNYDCGWDQVFTPAASFTSVAWRSDILLPVPQLQYPRPDAVMCLDTTPGSGSGIFLQWNTIAGATHYLVQWGGNPQLSGPDTREALVASPTIQYELLTDDDIRLGETVYWRVQAQNRTTGGTSSQSEVRQIKLECNNSTGSSGLDRCTDYDFEASIKGHDFMSCCDEQVYWLEMTFDSKDQFDRVLVDISQVVWSVNTSPTDPTPAFLKTSASSDFKVIVETCGDSESESQVIELKAVITFNDFVKGDTFDCEVSQKIFVDCDTPFHKRPWSTGGASPYCYPICLDYGYLDTEPMGLMYVAGSLLNYPYNTNMVTATGPVFKLPACVGIYTPCCECVPTTLGLFAGDGSTTLTHNSGSGSWYANELIPWLGCPGAIGPSEMYCADDGVNPPDWYFKTNIGCNTCVETDICLCVPEEFQLPISWETTGGTNPASGVRNFTFIHRGGQLWSGTGSFTPAGCDPLDATIELLFDSLDAFLFPTLFSGWTPDHDPNSVSGCNPTVVTFSLSSTNAGCSTTLTLTAAGLNVPNCDPCIPPLSLGYGFTPITCDPFYAAFTMVHDDMDEPLSIIITDGENCDCADDASGGSSVLEARVNIPLSCHFMVVDGMLALNLENLLGPGLSIGIGPTGCPYIYAAGGGGDCYSYHITYCCYTVYSIDTHSGGSFLGGGGYAPPNYESFSHAFNYEFQ